jgi:hypothetical protein
MRTWFVPSLLPPIYLIFIRRFQHRGPWWRAGDNPSLLATLIPHRVIYISHGLASRLTSSQTHRGALLDHACSPFLCSLHYSPFLLLLASSLPSAPIAFSCAHFFLPPPRLLFFFFLLYQIASPCPGTMQALPSTRAVEGFMSPSDTPTRPPLPLSRSCGCVAPSLLLSSFTLYIISSLLLYTIAFSHAHSFLTASPFALLFYRTICATLSPAFPCSPLHPAFRHHHFFAPPCRWPSLGARPRCTLIPPPFLSSPLSVSFPCPGSVHHRALLSSLIHIRLTSSLPSILVLAIPAPLHFSAHLDPFRFYPSLHTLFVSLRPSRPPSGDKIRRKAESDCMTMICTYLLYLQLNFKSKLTSRATEYGSVQFHPSKKNVNGDWVHIYLFICSFMEVCAVAIVLKCSPLSALLAPVSYRVHSRRGARFISRRTEFEFEDPRHLWLNMKQSQGN